MDTSADDEFWNISSSSGFNFDDEEDKIHHSNDFIFSSTAEENILQIHSIISKTGLDLILDDIKTTNHKIVAPTEETVKKMFYSLNFSLSQYKTLSEKLTLLDNAIDILDGNVITKIILYLRSTLTSNIFYHQLSKRKIALKHFTDYLITRNKLQELADMYMATGNATKINDLHYLVGRDLKKEHLIKKIEQFAYDHIQKNSDEEINDHINLLNWQKEHSQNCDSTIEQLAYLCKNWNKSHDLIQSFKKKMNIDDFSFEWVLLNALAFEDNWLEIQDFFLKPGWVKKKLTLKSAIKPETFVFCISRHKVPKDILEQYMSYIPSMESSIHLAQKLNCHRFVIQQYIIQKNRASLVDYRRIVSPQSEEYFLIEQGLKNMAI